MNFPFKKVLVTGGAGFIGSHCCETLLGLGAEVTVVDNFNDYYDPAIKEANLAAIMGSYYPRPWRYSRCRVGQ